MIDVSALVDSLLASFLMPLAKDAWAEVRTKLTEDFGEGAAKEASTLARRIRDKVRDALRGRGHAETFDEFEADPDAQADALRAALAAILQEDAALRDELAGLTRQPEPESSRPMADMVGDVVGAINISGGHFSGGRFTAVDNRRTTDRGPAPDS